MLGANRGSKGMQLSAEAFFWSRSPRLTARSRGLLRGCGEWTSAVASQVCAGISSAEPSRPAQSGDCRAGAGVDIQRNCKEKGTAARDRAAPVKNGAHPPHAVLACPKNGFHPQRTTRACPLMTHGAASCGHASCSWHADDAREGADVLAGGRRHCHLPREGQLEAVCSRFDDVAHGPIRERP